MTHARPTCASCRHYDADGSSCRKNPPTALPVPFQNPITGQTEVRSVGLFPAVPPDSWCGAHEQVLVRA